MEPYERIYCALDVPDLGAATELAAAVKGHVGGLKLGLEFYSAVGPDGIRAIRDLGLPVFLDLKLHDIPNTVAGAVRALAPLGAEILTVHVMGGPEMMRRAAAEAKDAAVKESMSAPKVIGVTVLTSLDEGDLADAGVSGSAEAQVVRMAELAQRSGLDGVVCSPREIAAVRRACGEDFLLVVPGIRPEGADVGDQKRVMTPPSAINAGADYLVIGRAITAADDPATAARDIAASIGS